MRVKTENRIVGIIRKIILFLLLLCAIGVYVDAEERTEMRIEQARICMPDIKVYYFGNGKESGEDLKVMLDNEKLTVLDQHPYSQDEAGSDYYILTDISLSIGKDYYANIRQALLDFFEGMGENDTFTLISFGDQVNVLAEKAGKNADIRSVIENLNSTDYNTHLFEALDKTTELADQEELQNRREVAIVITDGEDCSSNENTRNEALEQLQKVGIPLYAMAVKETASGAPNAFVEVFSDFAREANGKLFLFGKEEAVSCMQEIRSMLDSAQVIETRASSNRMKSVMQPLTVMIPGEASEAIQVCPRYNKKDLDPPTASAEQSGEKEIKITFSEPVKNANQESNYKVTLEGNHIPVNTVYYNEETSEGILIFSENLSGGEYKIEFQNITDMSIEEHLLKESIALQLEGEAEESSEAMTEEQTEVGIANWIYLVGGTLFLLIIFVIIILIIKKRKLKEDVPPVMKPSPVNFEVRSEEGEKTIEAIIEKKIIVGRSGGCDISLMDRLMSREHFSVERDMGDYYVRDLGTTNGTKVNGVEITGRCRLKNGDVIQAGSLHITITW